MASDCGATPRNCAREARARSTASSARINWFSARASSARVREASAPGRSSFVTSTSIAWLRILERCTAACAASTVSCAASMARKASAAAAPTCNRVTSTCAPSRFQTASARSTCAERDPKSKGSHETRAPTALPQTLDAALVPSTGPEIGEITGCGRSMPKTLLCVARFACPSTSSRGRYAVRARLIPAAAAETCSSEPRTAAYLSSACCTAWSRLSGCCWAEPERAINKTSRAAAKISIFFIRGPLKYPDVARTFSEAVKKL